MQIYMVEKLDLNELAFHHADYLVHYGAIIKFYQSSYWL